MQHSLIPGKSSAKISTLLGEHEPYNPEQLVTMARTNQKQQQQKKTHTTKAESNNLATAETTTVAPT